MDSPSSSENGESHIDSQRASFSSQSYFESSLFLKWVIGGIFALILFFFVHWREIYVEPLELASAAKRYVVAQVDFAFPDEEATIILRQEMAHEIGTIWRIQEAEICQRIVEFQKYITQNAQMRALWEKEPVAVHDSVTEALNCLRDSLSQHRFTDRKTLQRIEQLPADELPIPVQEFFAFVPIKLGSFEALSESLEVTLKDAASSSQEPAARLPSSFWVHLHCHPAEQATWRRVLLNYFEPLLWSFEVDQGTEYSLRKIIQKKIPEKFTHVKAGERLIDQGEKVTARHIAILHAMKETLNQSRKLTDPAIIAGSLLITLLFMAMGVIFIRETQPEILQSNRKLALLVTILALAMLFAKGGELLVLKQTTSWIDSMNFSLVVPFAAILLTSLFQARLAAFIVVLLTLIDTLALAVEKMPFLVINLVASMVAILATRVVRKRKELFFVSAKSWLAGIPVICIFNLYGERFFSLSIFGDLSSTFLMMAITAILVVGLLPILESIFQILTEMTLMEFMDPSHVLLRRLTIEAPGTYQHSMLVGHLAETAATAIGMNGLFCRVATQYHDIGKIVTPQYFTENQMSGIDMHQLLTPSESAQVIISHVSEGVVLARSAGLPEPFIDIIQQHHGTTLVYYFYHKQIALMGGDKARVSEETFRYSGPKPRSKESTIIMIADSLEAASRCLDFFNRETIAELVETLIAHKMEDGQFDESLLTFEELAIVKKTLVHTLLATSHPRIKYPPHHPGEEG